MGIYWNSLVKGVFYYLDLFFKKELFKKMKDIKDFRIGIAHYILENDEGSRLELKLDYGRSSFSYDVIKEKGKLDKLKKQAGIIAKDMLGRKARKNLNYKLLQLKI